ncbi:MAG TPA: ABC transporter substrate-binding protein [Chloroflexota bacterium]|nr:ABC transporter substrate-binding protein [Chloroflexota bacterium]
MTVLTIHGGLASRARRIAVLGVIAAVSLLATFIPNAGVSAKSKFNGTITFGVLHPFTGAYASVGEASLQGVTTAAAEINANGGVLGKKLLVAHADTLADPVDAVPAARHLIATSSPAAIIGPGGLEITAVQSILDQAKIPFEFEGGDTAYDHTTDPMLWRDSPSDEQEGVAMALFAMHKGFKKAAFMMSSITSAQDFIPYIEGAYKKLGGQIVANEVMTPGLSSYRSEVLKVVQAHPQVIFTQVEPPTAAVMTRDLKEIDNLKIPFIATDTSTAPEWISAVTPAVAHADIWHAEGATLNTGATPTFMKFLHKAHKGAQPLASANYAYDGAIVLALAIEKAGTTNGPTFAKDIPKVASPPGKQVTNYGAGVKWIKKRKDINYQGASGSMDYNKYHNVFGPFEIVKSDSHGNLKQVTIIGAKAIEKATP